eukprot:m.1475849 g.1475849  ORF g.1475849 m.1475849 type:complete len:1525 (+) comp25156_c0_seq6:241-4815(+)
MIRQACGRLLHVATRQVVPLPAVSVNHVAAGSVPALFSLQQRTLYTKKRTPARLELEDGSIFHGYSFGAVDAGAGEVVFNTSMTSYPESITDPSYKGQILTATYPLIGNFGAPDHKAIDEYGLIKYLESDKIHVSGLVCQEYSEHYAHFEATQSLSKWMEQQGVPGITGVDTRELTKTIRKHGSLLGKIVPSTVDDIPFENPNLRNLIAEVSRSAPVMYSPPGGGDIDIVAVDCGVKMNIIRELVKRGANVKVVPWDYDVNQEACDGLFYSNGPGDPSMAGPTIEHLKVALQGDKPIFGICMGHQLMAIASGAKTEKMMFGNRGQNIPCINLEDRRCYITPQNHGYAVNADTLTEGWKPLFTNTNDGSNEGCRHETKPFLSVQFHPEARGGPQDTAFLFDSYINQVRQHRKVAPMMSRALGPSLVSDRGMDDMFKKKTSRITFPSANVVPKFEPLSKVLVLGSGGLSIGQAGEFDYSGSQAIKALKDKNIQSVLINPNIATVQTAEGLADSVYLLPVTPEFVTEVIRKEKPDGIFLQFGGQTALNCGIALDKAGVFKEHGVRVLGTSVDSIIATEDRQIFADKLVEIGEKIATSMAATTTDAAIAAAHKIGFPVIVRTAFSLGGLGSGFAHDEAQLRALCSRAFSSTPQVLVEKSLKGWKEVEYEVVRDQYDNCVTVCNMENFDPLGIHTGDSIVVAPSQTLSDADYHLLRTASMRTARHLGIIGECNVQFALDPHSRDYCIIEVNPRLSRSSALASKATGYPLAWVAAKLAIGENLADVRNLVTGETTACFEPSLDYVVTKVPRWDLKKFNNASTVLGSGMKSVGEVMAIGRTFEESLQKALRMVDPGNPGMEPREFDDVVEALTIPTEQRIFAVVAAMKSGYTLKSIHQMTHIDYWFLRKLEHIIQVGEHLENFDLASVPHLLMEEAKKAGFSDKQIGMRVGSAELDVRSKRKEMGIVPVVKQIDTLAAEYPAQTNYLYTTYNGSAHDMEFNNTDSAMVLGSGVYRIGSSVEFDYSAVQCIRKLRELGKESIMVNYNPETVSTDYDESDRLYFEELSQERVLDIHDLENPMGTIVSVGGQLPNNLALGLHQQGVNVLGTHPDNIDRAEDRDKYSSLMTQIGVDQPAWCALTSVEEASKFCDDVGYPVLVRPSYVLSGAAMNVVRSADDLDRYLREAVSVSKEHPVVISKFIEGAREIDFDAIASKGKLVVYAVSKHVENAGVHSGDATLVLPARGLEPEIHDRIIAIGEKIAKALEISGPMNCQFIVSDDGSIKVIETNVRASRSLPFVSKVLDCNFIDLATRIFCGEDVQPQPVDLDTIHHTAVKVPQFSFARLLGADPVLGVEMASTGEVACFGANEDEAFIKALMASTIRLPKKTILLSTGESKDEFLPSARLLCEMGYELHATPETAAHLLKHGIEVQRVPLPRENNYYDDPHDPDVLHSIRNKHYDMMISFPKSSSLGLDPNNEEQRTMYRVRRAAVDYNLPIITNPKVAQLLVKSLATVNELSADSFQDIKAKIGK